jgi:uncharacterized protein YciI
MEGGALVRREPPGSIGDRPATTIAPVIYAVRLERGGPWDWSRDMCEQDGWDQHARFMDSLVEDGFLLLGGPLEGDGEVLHVVEAPSEDAVRGRLTQDNWHRNGMLRVKSIDGWTVVLDGLRR